jgi:hypothetical protein
MIATKIKRIGFLWLNNTLRSWTPKSVSFKIRLRRIKTLFLRYIQTTLYVGQYYVRRSSFLCFALANLSDCSVSIIRLFSKSCKSKRPTQTFLPLCKVTSRNFVITKPQPSEFYCEYEDEFGNRIQVFITFT